MAPSCRQSEEHLLTYKSLILTLFARHETNTELKALGPLSLEEFKPFFHQLFGYGKEKPSTPHNTTIEVKKVFLNWLSEQSETPAHAITEQLGKTLDGLFEEMDAELGAVSPEDLDPRFISLFWIS